MAALKIQESGFRVDLAGTNAGALLGPGVYCTTTLQKALNYAKGKEANGVVLELKIDLGRCKELRVNDPMMRSWQDQGFDSAWMPQGANSAGLEENCIKDPKRIKIVNVIAGHTGALNAMGMVISNGRLRMKSDEGQKPPVRQESSSNLCCICLSGQVLSHAFHTQLNTPAHTLHAHKRANSPMGVLIGCTHACACMCGRMSLCVRAGKRDRAREKVGERVSEDKRP